jgi:hypothetical protein
MRITAGYTWTDQKTNMEVANELNITPVLDKIQDCKRNRTQHAKRMPRNRFPRILKECIPKGRRNQGRPMKQLLGETGRGQQVAQRHGSYMTTK